MTTTNAANSSPITAGDAVNTPNEWAPKRIWLQREAGEGASHTWCEDSQAPEHEEASYIREDFTGTLSADYLSGHQDGLDWAALVVEYTDPRTGDWMYDDPHDLAKAIRKGPDMSAYQSAPTVPQQAGDVLTAMRERLFADIAALMDYTPSNPVVAEIRASLAAPRQPGEMGTGVQPGICPKCGLPNDELCAECPQPSAQQDEREALSDEQIVAAARLSGLSEFIGYDRAELGVNLRRFARVIEKASAAQQVQADAGAVVQRRLQSAASAITNLIDDTNVGQPNRYISVEFLREMRATLRAAMSREQSQEKGGE